MLMIFISLLSQMQSTFLHSLHHYHFPGTAIIYSGDCSTFLLVLLLVLLPQQSASKVSFQTANPGTSFLRLKCTCAAALFLGNVWTPKLCVWILACLPGHIPPLSASCAHAPQSLCKLSSGATKMQRASHTSRPV